ncbi:MAG: hypothetical protein KBT31_07005, partial [Firmicutes bacterium]|nr:hypothetical protein [Candidatus Colimorpha enterica]
MKQTGTDFNRPYAKELLGSDKVTHYAYPREELISHKMFPYFVFDGGAFNFANDRLGTTDGDDILDLTMSGKLFDVFTLDGRFN